MHERSFSQHTRKRNSYYLKHTTLTKIESDVVIKPSVQTVAKIAKALDVPIEDLVK
jgi:transcriptional regulator with XRE-family HTH domain